MGFSEHNYCRVQLEEKNNSETSLPSGKMATFVTSIICFKFWTIFLCTYIRRALYLFFNKDN